MWSNLKNNNLLKKLPMAKRNPICGPYLLYLSSTGNRMICTILLGVDQKLLRHGQHLLKHEIIFQTCSVGVHLKKARMSAIKYLL